MNRVLRLRLLPLVALRWTSKPIGGLERLTANSKIQAEGLRCLRKDLVG